MIKGKSAEEIRRTFNITNDFTPEEEAQIKKENVSKSIYMYIHFLSVKLIQSLYIRNGLRIVEYYKYNNK
jgi:hypothetical protein